MPIPLVYDETTLAQYMHAELGKIAGVLDYDEPVADAGPYQEPVNEVMLSLGVTDLATAPDIRKVRALARLEAWRMATNDLVTKYNFSSDGASYDRSQMHEQAGKALERAVSDCVGLGVLPGYSASIDTIEYHDDPYGFPKHLEG